MGLMFISTLGLLNEGPNWGRWTLAGSASFPVKSDGSAGALFTLPALR